MIRGVQDTEKERPQVERERSAAAAAMLGMPGFVVIAVSEHDGEIEQAIETTADLVGCPSCAAVARCHDRRPVWVRDLPSAGRPVTLVWIKRVWRCPHPLCPIRTWTETSPAIAARASLTARARLEICRRVGEDGASVAAVAREFGIGWHTAMAAVCEHGQPRLNDQRRLAGVVAVGVDETAFQAAAAHRSTSFVTGIVDLTRGRGPARLLDIVAGRSASALLGWIGERDAGWRGEVTTAALDPYRGYASALRTALPDAVRVLDAFQWCGSGSPLSMMSGAASSRNNSGIVAAPTTPSTASAGYCGGATTTTPTAPGRGCLPGSTPAIPLMSNSPAPGSPPRTCG
jgi:transposase